MGKYFGTDGFRGEANVTLTAKHAFKIGRFLGWYFNQTHQHGDENARIVIGKDTRRSSYMLEYALAAGITSSGADAYLLHVTTTPSVAYITKADSFDCGIMISASHNPFYDNGIKLINDQGEKMEDEVLAKIEDFLDGKSGIPPYGTRDKIGQTVEHVSVRNRYMGYLISLGRFSFKGKRIALDCANGSAWNIAPGVFNSLGAKVYLLNAEPDGVNINRNAGSTHIEGLQKYVVENKLDVGFAYDGDADRCLCVDENGQVVDGDKILYIYAKYLQERGKMTDDNAVVATVMSNLGLFKALEELGIGYAKRIEVTLAKKLPHSELDATEKIYPQVLENVRVTDKRMVMSAPLVQQAVAQAEAKLEGNGRMLVRESGTEPLVRVMAEAADLETCRACIKIVTDAIDSCGFRCE